MPPSTVRMRKTSGRVVLLLHYYYMITYNTCFILITYIVIYYIRIYYIIIYNTYYTSYIIDIIIPILEMEELGLSQSLFGSQAHVLHS